jgi:cytochrome c553
MRNAQTSVLSRAVATTSALLLAGAVIVITAGQSMATPAIAAKEKKACAACHTAPPALNDAGKKYKASH